MSHDMVNLSNAAIGGVIRRWSDLDQSRSMCCRERMIGRDRGTAPGVLHADASEGIATGDGFLRDVRFDDHSALTGRVLENAEDRGEVDGALAKLGEHAVVGKGRVIPAVGNSFPRGLWGRGPVPGRGEAINQREEPIELRPRLDERAE